MPPAAPLAPASALLAPLATPLRPRRRAATPAAAAATCRGRTVASWRHAATLLLAPLPPRLSPLPCAASAPRRCTRVRATPPTRAAADEEPWTPPVSPLRAALERASKALGLGPGLQLAAAGGMLASTGFDLEGPGSVAVALSVLAGIIFVHECGHFGAARALGVHVTKFAVGFGPKLISFKDAEVEYSLGLVPLGGFVAFPDDDPDSPWPADDPDLLRNRPLAHRAAVVVAGVVANVVCAYALLTTQALTVGQLEQTYLPGVRVPVLLGTESAAERAGIRPGDLILSLDGVEVAPNADSVSRLVTRIKLAKADAPLTFTLARAGEPQPLTVAVTPVVGPTGGRIGVQLEANTRVTHRQATSLPQALSMAAADFVRLTGVVTHGLSEIVLNFSNTVDQISGPVAIVAVGAQVARGDSAGIFQFASIININLAVVNLLPLPALDGGFLALLALEGVRGGKKLPVEVEQTISGSGLLLLMGSGVVLLVRDTLHLDFVRNILH